MNESMIVGEERVLIISKELVGHEVIYHMWKV